MNKIVAVNFSAPDLLLRILDIFILKSILARDWFSSFFNWSFAVSNHMCLNPFKNCLVYFSRHWNIFSGKWKIAKMFYLGSLMLELTVIKSWFSKVRTCFDKVWPNFEKLSMKNTWVFWFMNGQKYDAFLSQDKVDLLCR